MLDCALYSVSCNLKVIDEVYDSLAARGEAPSGASPCEHLQWRSQAEHWRRGRRSSSFWVVLLDVNKIGDEDDDDDKNEDGITAAQEGWAAL